MALAISTWALFHGLTVLRRQGSLASRLPRTTPEAMIDVARTLTGVPRA